MSAESIAVRVIRAFTQSAGRSKDELAKMGEAMFEVTYSRTRSDIEALALANEWMTALPYELNALIGKLSGGSAGSIAMIASARWADLGFPTFIIPQKTMAAWMATSVTDQNTLDEIRPPFPAFVVDIPPGLVQIDDPYSGTTASVIRMLANFYQKQPGEKGYAWRFVCFTDSGVIMWRVHRTRDLTSVDADFTSTEEFALPIGDRDTRAMIALGRLIISICFATANPDNLSRVGRKDGAKTSGKKRKSDVPLVRHYNLGKTIEIDVRDAVASYIATGKTRSGSAPTVQTLVRGHWKPQLSARVGHHVWIEPYWRGPEDAPILVRPTKIKPNR